MSRQEKIIKRKLGLLELAQQCPACKIMGYSRASFYGFQELYDNGGAVALKEISRSKPIMTNRVNTEAAQAVVGMATEPPAYGQLRVSNALNKKGLFVGLVGSEVFGWVMIWKRLRSGWKLK
jgi:hypothetical protein